MKEWIGGSGAGTGATDAVKGAGSSTAARNGTCEWWQKSQLVQQAPAGSASSPASYAVDTWDAACAARQQLSAAARVTWTGSSRSSKMTRKRRIFISVEL